MFRLCSELNRVLFFISDSYFVRGFSRTLYGGVTRLIWILILFVFSHELYLNLFFIFDSCSIRVLSRILYGGSAHVDAIHIQPMLRYEHSLTLSYVTNIVWRCNPPNLNQIQFVWKHELYLVLFFIFESWYCLCLVTNGIHFNSRIAYAMRWCDCSHVVMTGWCHRHHPLCAIVLPIQMQQLAVDAVGIIVSTHALL